jgi:hypothetical protein
MDGWSELEEKDFAELMEVGHFERLPAIRLYRRCWGSLTKALAIAQANAPTAEQIARGRKLAALRTQAPVEVV